MRSLIKITRQGVMVVFSVSFILFEEVSLFFVLSKLKFMTPNSGATYKSDSNIDKYD
jgi:hypothetical protein